MPALPITPSLSEKLSTSPSGSILQDGDDPLVTAAPPLLLTAPSSSPASLRAPGPVNNDAATSHSPHTVPLTVVTVPPCPAHKHCITLPAPLPALTLTTRLMLYDAASLPTCAPAHLP